MADTLDGSRVEAQGSTLGEAKWAAVKALEPVYPGVDADTVTFEVVSDGTDGDEAHVVAEVDVEAWRSAMFELPREPTERVRTIVGRIALALGYRASVDVVEAADEIRATLNCDDDMGLFIGKHGTTIDAVQALVARAAFRGDDERKLVIVDAAGYRERREAALHRAADAAVEDAVSFGRPVELDPMSAHERKLVHRYLAERTDIDTHSEGDEPDRRLVVTRVAP